MIRYALLLTVRESISLLFFCKPLEIRYFPKVTYLGNPDFSEIDNLPLYRCFLCKPLKIRYSRLQIFLTRKSKHFEKVSLETNLVKYNVVFISTLCRSYPVSLYLKSSQNQSRFSQNGRNADRTFWLQAFE